MNFQVPKLLVADDEPAILSMITDIFEPMGYQVITVTDGQKAIDMAIETHPDMVIVDVLMPKKNGFEVCRAIRNHPNLEDIPIVLLSAMADEYNRLTGFEEGADDYIIKPFQIDEIKSRINALLSHPNKSADLLLVENAKPDLITANNLGITALESSLPDGLPRGSNILVTGPIGCGKSSFCRAFIVEGIKNTEACLFVAIDDSPQQIRRQLIRSLGSEFKFESNPHIQFVDAYSWSSLSHPESEAYAINGILELNQLSGVISDAGYELGHSAEAKLGGRRVIDSISSLLINFELPSVQRFIGQISRTAIAFGGITTLFVMEEGTVSNETLNNIKYLMDGIIEFSNASEQRSIRVASMKWTSYSNEWKPLWKGR